MTVSVVGYRSWLVTGLLLVGCLLAAGRGVAGDSPNGKLISEVIPVGNRLRKTEDIRAVMLSRPGMPYDPATIQEDIRRLYTTKWFQPESINIIPVAEKDGRVKLIVRVAELISTIEDVQFIGAQHLSHNELMTLAGVRKGEPMNPLMNQIGQQSILRKYREEEGRTYASVELVEGKLATDTRVIYQIVEGPVVKVARVEIRGAARASVGRLEAQLVTKKDLGILPTKYNPMNLDLDRQKIIEYYQGLGFLSVTVNWEVIPTEDVSRIVIVYHIVEGQQYTVAGKQLNGNKSFDTATLMGLTALQPGEPYDRRKVEADVKRMKDYMGTRGYQTIVEEQHFDVPGQPGLVQVHYNVINDPGAPKHIGRVIIEGNEITQDRIILRQLGLYPGQVFDYPQLEAAKARLARLGIFDSEGGGPVVEVLPNEWDSVYQDVLVRVKETRTGTFMVGASVNSDMGLNGNITLNERNFDITRLPTSWDDFIEGRAFRGGDQEFRVEASPGTEFSRYGVTWREPSLYDTPFGLTVSGYFREMEVDEYTEERLGVRFTLDRRLDPIWTASVSTRVEAIDIKDVPIPGPAVIDNDAGHQFLVGVRAGITRDTRDSYIFPTQGSIFDAGIEQVMGTFQYPIATMSYTQFLSSKYFAREDGSGQQVLCLRSLVEVEGGNAPVYERFYGGGISSFRGFTFRGVGPFQEGYAVGGNFAFLNTIEYQVPLMAKDGLWGVIFCDHGTVEQNIAIHNYRVAIGAGLRVSIPMLGPLPIALDFAVPLNQAPQDHKQVFSFSMGLFGGPGGGMIH